MPMQKKIAELRTKGVNLLQPETIYVAPEVRVGCIQSGVTIHAGCRLSGERLFIGAGSEIGREGPATLNDCQLGEGVALAGGFFDSSTFLDGAKAGSGAHVRSGSLFEEEASIAHSVGVKQTLLMPWATTGSLVNLCDCLLAGGTSLFDHSEVGSSYIHFNFTPHQDKATPSLIGDVPHGVLLNQPPIFLGGQGGLVGPCRIAYGTVIAAGQIWRGDVVDPGLLLSRGGARTNIRIPYDTRQFSGLGRILRHNLAYIGNLLALFQWYRVARNHFMSQTEAQRACHKGALHKLTLMLEERFFRLGELAGKVEEALRHDSSDAQVDGRREFVERWPQTKDRLQQRMDDANELAIPESIANLIASWPNKAYIETIQGLSPGSQTLISQWLEGQVEEVVDLAL